MTVGETAQFAIKHHKAYGEQQGETDRGLRGLT
jgi:FKBP-type peptidyl-prolyl cis-trans isomerase